MEARPIYDIWQILNDSRTDSEAEIRALCQTAYLGDHVALCRVLGRYKMYVDTNDIGIASHLMLEGYWEMWVTAAMMQHVRPGSTVIDIGANLGYFTLLMADLTGSDGRCLSFEPNPIMASLVDKNIRVNGMAPITTLYQCALGSAAGVVAMEVDPIQPGGGHVIPYVEGSGPAAIPIKRLDEIPGALEADFIKMDVEGSEHDVWLGMSAILESGRPLTIFMEFTVSRFADPHGFLDEISAAGFSLEVIDHHHGILPITREELFMLSHTIDHMLVLRRG